MTISRESYDRTKRYRKVRFHQDRDLLDAELNEVQEIGLQERTRLFDALLPPGAIVRGLETTVNGAQVTVTAGAVYLDGHLEDVPGTTLAYDPAKSSGVDSVWVEVLHKAISVADDPALINTQTGEPTAEREQWLVSLKSRDTATDPVPTGMTARTTVAIYTFDRATGILTPCVAGVLRPEERIRLDAHIGFGGTDQHPAATTGQAGFLTAVDKSKLDTLSTTVPPTHIHDDRYYTESETDTKLTGKANTTHNHDTAYAPVSHVGASGAAHPGATPGAAGFLSGTDKTKLDQLSTTTPPAHLHDDRYYTEGETETRLAAKSDTTHVHDAAYTPLAHAGAGGAAHAAATSSANGFFSAADKTKLDTLSTTTPPTHTHDDRYFTETELGATTGGSAGAGKVGVTPSGGISASNVQAALQELDADKAAAGHNHESAYAPLGHVGAAGGAHPAATETVAGFLSAADKTKLDSINTATPPDHTHDDRYVTETDLSATTNGSAGATKIGVTPTGNISATNVQAALTELDTEKAATEHHHDAMYVLAGHAGAGGAVHAAADPGAAGFLSAADKTKLDALSTTIPPAHHHDDRYYTEGETDTKLGTKADTGHNHDAAYPPLAHVGAGGTAHTAATAGVAGFLSAVDKIKLDTLSTTTPPTHIHDDRYYTESETEIKLATKADTSHQHDSAYAPLNHVGAGAAAHAPASGAVAGFMTSADKTKLDGVTTGATRGQRTATIVVAASNSSDAGKSAADYVCTGLHAADPRTGDQDTINAAITTVSAQPGGGKVLLLEGTYNITGPIRLSNKVVLSGVGLSTHLDIPAGYTDLGAFNMVENSDLTNGNSDLVVCDLSLDGSSGSNTGTGSHGIYWWGAVRGLVERVFIQGCAGHGIYLAGNSAHPTWYTAVRECTVDICRGIGIYWYGNGWMNALTDSFVLRSEAEGGVKIAAMGEMLVTDNRIYYNSQHGLVLDSGCARMTVANNIISHNGTSADNTYDNLRISLADRCLVTGNLIRRYMMGADLDQAKYGIHIAAGMQNFITGNHLYEAGKTDDLLDEGTLTYCHANVTSAGLEAP
ncbi:MAG: DUF4815 domain-containing protein [Armatimonadota bacterium]